MTELSKLPRIRGWEHRLAAALSDEASRPFEWGVADCLCLIGNAAQAVIGVDPMSSYRGRYQTEMGARRVLLRAGFASLQAALAAQFEDIGPSLARRGDCGLVETGIAGAEHAAVVVCGAELMGKSRPASPGGTGITIISRNRLVRAFRIGA